jgi:hypothetical protein
VRSVLVLEEPTLEFRHGQRVADPRVGLSLFGPYDADLPSHPGSIPYGLVGTAVGLNRFSEFVDVLRRQIVDDSNRRNPNLWVEFPGFEAAFGSTLPAKPAVSEEVDSTSLSSALKIADRNRRAFAVVDHYVEAITRVMGGDRPPLVILCIVPDSVHESCRPQSSVQDAVGLVTPQRERLARMRGIKDITHPGESIEPFRFSPDFRRQIKARAMRFEPPIQILRESTLRSQDMRQPGERILSPLSDRAWNLCTTLYYKAGGRPWRLATARD